MNIISHLKFSLRLFYRDLGSSLLGIFVLGIGLAMAITMYTLAKTFLWNSPTLTDDQPVLSLSWAPTTEGRHGRTRFNFLDFEELKQYSQSFEHVTAYKPVKQAFFAQGEEAEVSSVLGTWVNDNFFELFAVKPLLGRLPTPEDALASTPAVIVINEELWHSEFAGDANVIGRQVSLNGLPRTVIGVLPAAFKFPLNQLFWEPYHWQEHKQNGRKRGSTGVNIVGVLKKGVSIEQAELELVNFAQVLTGFYEKKQKWLTQIKLDVFDAREARMKSFRAILLALIIGSLIVLVVACANVSNLLLAKASKRQFELAMRHVLGASRLEIALQVLLDAFLIALLGALLGLLLASWACRAIWHLFENNYSDMPYWWHMDIDAKVLAFALLMLIITILVSAISPIVKTTRRYNAEAVKDNARTSSSLAVSKAGKWLVGVQVTLTATLLCCAGTFVIAMQDQLDRQLKYEPASILTNRYLLTYSSGYHSNESVVGFYQSMKQKLDAIPGVDDVAFSTGLLDLGVRMRTLEIESQPQTKDDKAMMAATDIVTLDYFDFFNKQPLQGRFFSTIDTEQAGHVAVVNQTFVEVYFPNENPLGKRIRIKEPGDPWEHQNKKRTSPWTQWLTIVGVTPNINTEKGLADAQKLGNTSRFTRVYIPHTQFPARQMSLMLRGQGEVKKYAKHVGKAFADESHKIAPFTSYKTLEDIYEIGDLFKILIGQFVSGFALVTLIMAATGLYGLATLTTEQQSREFGIRRALGAKRRNIITLVTQTVRLQLSVGLILGVSIGFLLTNILEKNLGQSNEDLFTELWFVFPAAAIVVLMVLLVAIIPPAWRAANLPPNQTLRQA